MKYEQTYIPPAYRDPLCWRVAHWACVGFFCIVVLSGAIGGMWLIAMVKQAGGFEQFLTGVDDGEAHTFK